MEEQFQELELYRSVAKASSVLDQNENTFTGYYLKFEKQGYTFKRSKDNKVIFSEDEIEMFRDFLAEKNKPRTTVEQAIKTVIKKYLTTPETEVSITARELSTLTTVFEKKFEELQLQSSKQFEELKDGFKQLQLQLQESQEQVKLLEQQEVKERDKMLMESIGQWRETTKEVRELKEMMISQQEAAASKNKKWWVFWK